MATRTPRSTGPITLKGAAALREHAEWLGATLAGLGDAVIATDAAGVVTFLNSVATRFTGLAQAEAAGRPLAEVFLGTARSSDSSSTPVLDEAGRVLGAILIVRDASERQPSEEQAEAALRESERRHRFFAELATLTQPLYDPGAIMEAAARLLAEHLEVDRCAYAQVEDESIFVITGDYFVGVPSIVGRWPVAAFGEVCLRHMLANEPYVVEDVSRDPRLAPTDLAAYHATTIQSVICVPLHKAGRFTAAMAVHKNRPRVFTAAEVQLVRSVVGQCWEALERAQVTRTLRESEARYRAIVDATPECVKLVAFDGTILQINPAGLAMIEADDLTMAVGKSVYAVIAPADRDAFRAFHEAVCRGQGGTLRYELMGLRGTRRQMETTAVALPNPDGGYTHLGLTRDVTDHVAAEISLRRSEESYRRAAAEAAQAAEANAKFRAFFDQGTNFAGVLALDGRMLEANRLCLDACGFTRDEVIGRPFWECGWWNRSPDLMAMVRAGCAQAVTGRLFRTESSYFVASGELRMVDLSLAPVTDAEGRVLFVAATGNDITERRHMEDSLRAADRLKDEFIALLAHELRNPLAPIRNGLQVMGLVRGDAEATDRARAMMERQLGHMVRLIDDLLDVSRINRKKMELRCARVQLADVVNSAVETARPLIDAEGHDLVVALPARPLYLNADLTRLAQVFSNLLTNSAKYTERGGRIRLSAEQRGNEVAVSVQDNGIGIPTESLGSIFDMFAQLNRPLERSSGGLGIGLALVKGLVEMHGGSVVAESRGQGQGSLFTVRLPLLEAPIEPLAAPPIFGRAAPSGPQRRILVVDDNRDGADSLSMMLQLLGNDVRVAHDGLEAVTAAEDFRPHIILMDLGMPRLNGYDATRRIRELDWGKAIRIIALTGWGQEADRARSKEAGCDGHLVKPVNLLELEKILARIIPA